MKCQICRRRQGSIAHLDEDLIGPLCPKCHFDLVCLFHLLVQATEMMRRLDWGLAARMVKARLTLGAANIGPHDERGIAARISGDHNHGSYQICACERIRTDHDRG